MNNKTADTGLGGSIGDAASLGLGVFGKGPGALLSAGYDAASGINNAYQKGKPGMNFDAITKNKDLHYDSAPKVAETKQAEPELIAELLEKTALLTLTKLRGVMTSLGEKARAVPYLGGAIRGGDKVVKGVESVPYLGSFLGNAAFGGTYSSLSRAGASGFSTPEEKMRAMELGELRKRGSALSTIAKGLVGYVGVPVAGMAAGGTLMDKYLDRRDAKLRARVAPETLKR